jgi:hypothetical protein
MHTSRRVALSGAALFTLAGCTMLKNLLGTTPAQWAMDVSLIASGVASVAAAVAQVPNVAASSVAQVQADAKLIAEDATKVANSTATVVAGTSTATIIEEVAATTQAVADIVLPLFPQTSPFVPIVNAAVALVPGLLAQAGISGTPVVIVPKAPAYTPAEARQILGQVAKAP